METGFVKKFELLEETSKVKDLLDFSVQCESFVKKINSIQSSSVIALVGPFGSGKSTMLHQIITKNANNDLWVEFDAWKYPERKDLWEGLVLDFADQIGEKKKVDKQITGKGTTSKIIDVGTDIISIITDKLPRLDFIDKFTEFFKKSPATRVFELQEIFKRLLDKPDKNIYIIVEDIDRSGDAGVFFLETLKQFLISIKLEKKLVVIVPIANHNYQKNIDSYLKCVDYFEFFELSELKLDNFVDEIFNNDLFVGEFRIGSNKQLIWSGDKRRTETISFLEGLFREMPETTMRMLKLIIRKANLVYRNQVADGHEPDYRITLCLEASKYYKADEKLGFSFFDDFKKRGVVTRGNIFSSFMLAILANQATIYRIQHTENGEKKDLIESKNDFKFIERLNNDKVQYPSYPWTYRSFDSNGESFGMASFYKNY